MEKHTFEYTYSSERQAEIRRIASRYAPVQEDPLEQLRRLDGSVSRKAQIRSLTIGILGTLIMGTGMSLIMSELGAFLGENAIWTGIVTGVAGMLLVALAYPVYTHTIKKERQRIAPQIQQLSQQLLQE